MGRWRSIGATVPPKRLPERFPKLSDDEQNQRVPKPVCPDGRREQEKPRGPKNWPAPIRGPREGQQGARSQLSYGRASGKTPLRGRRQPFAGGAVGALIDLATRYNNRCGGSPGYLHQWKMLLRRLPWEVADLTPDRIDAYLTDALAHLSPSTVHRHRRMLGLLMRFAHEEGLLNSSTVPRPLRRVKVPPPRPVAWTHAEIAELIAVAETMPRGTKNCAYATLMPAWIMAAYDTGLRTEDLRALRWDAIRGNHALVSQSKTGEPHVVALSDRTLRAIHLLPRNGPSVFGGLISGVQILRIMRRVVNRAGLTGSTKFLRRSGATYCEMSGVDASSHLGHRSPGMKRYYVDRLLVANAREVRPPPSLPEST